MLATGQTEPRRALTGVGFTPQQLVAATNELAGDWQYDAVSIGYPGQVGDHGPRQEPGNLGFGLGRLRLRRGVRPPGANHQRRRDAALGSYDGGRMLFLGLGTGLGSTLIAENVIVPLELGNIPEPGGRTLGDVLGRAGMKRMGKKQWQRAIAWAVPALMASMLADYVVIGGGNAKEIQEQPPGSRLSNNQTAFRGGFRVVAPGRREDACTTAKTNCPTHAENRHVAADLAVTRPNICATEIDLLLIFFRHLHPSHERPVTEELPSVVGIPEEFRPGVGAEIHVALLDS